MLKKKTVILKIIFTGVSLRKKKSLKLTRFSNNQCNNNNQFNNHNKLFNNLNNKFNNQYKIKKYQLINQPDSEAVKQRTKIIKQIKQIKILNQLSKSPQVKPLIYLLKSKKKVTLILMIIKTNKQKKSNLTLTTGEIQAKTNNNNNNQLKINQFNKTKIPSYKMMVSKGQLEEEIKIKFNKTTTIHSLLDQKEAQRETLNNNKRRTFSTAKISLQFLK